MSVPQARQSRQDETLGGRTGGSRSRTSLPGKPGESVLLPVGIDSLQARDLLGGWQVRELLHAHLHICAREQG